MAGASHRYRPKRGPQVLWYLTLGAALWFGGCHGSVPLVPVGPPPSAPIPGLEVDTFPPPAKVEVIPLRRQSECYWQDGYWDARPRLFGSSEWNWRPGSWVLVPKGCYYAPPRTEVERSSTRHRLLYTRGAYYPYDPKVTCAPAEECR
jgi:hypothetical protein